MPIGVTRLRVGQALDELGNKDEGLNRLLPAYLAGGAGLFEDEAPKDLTFVRRRLKESGRDKA